MNNEIIDREGYRWKTAIIPLDNGEEIRIATDGDTVRIMSINHLYTEVQLVVDKNHCVDIPMPIRWSKEIDDGWRPFYPDFIKKNEMMI